MSDEDRNSIKSTSSGGGGGGSVAISSNGSDVQPSQLPFVKPRTRSMLVDGPLCADPATVNADKSTGSAVPGSGTVVEGVGTAGALAVLLELAEARKLYKSTAQENAEMKQYVENLNSECLELHDSLFQEANKQVSEALQAKDRVEKRCVELERQSEVLTSEVAALKGLIERTSPAVGHKRSGSYTEVRQAENLTDSEIQSFELDPLVYGEFLDWLNNPGFDCDKSAFMSRIVNRDIRSCLDFANRELADQVIQAALANQLHIEVLSSGRDRSEAKPRCSLMKSKLCHYRIRLADGDPTPWHYISHCARNRIIATCNLLHYLRYVMQGLLPSATSSDKFTEIQSHRRNMYVAMLGFQM